MGLHLTPLSGVRSRHAPHCPSATCVGGLDGGRQAVPGQNVTIQVNIGAFAPGGFIAFGPPQTTDSNASLTADVVRWAVWAVWAR